MRKLNILVIGAGAYTCGVSTDDYGTILPSLLEANNQNLIGTITIVSRTSKTLEYAKQKSEIIKKKMVSNININFYKADMTIERELCKILKTSSFDAAIISVPDHLHAKISIPIINNKVSVLVVKPMAIKLNEGKKKWLMH